MLTTLETLKKQLKIPEDDTILDDDLMFHILAASQAIENHCDRKFKRQQYTEILDGSGSHYLVLSNYPVYSGTITIDNEEIAIDSSESGVIFNKYGWRRGMRNAVAVYEGGYVLPSDATNDNPRTLPEAVEMACIFAIKGMIRNPNNVKSERIGGDISVTYSDGDSIFTPSVKALLSPYVGRYV